MSEPQNNEIPTADSEHEKFDEKILDRFRCLIQEVAATHPEFRSASVSIDYHGVLNDTLIGSAVWLGDQGPVTRLDAMFGSAMQTLKLLQYQCDRIQQGLQDWQAVATALGEKIVKIKSETDAAE